MTEKIDVIKERVPLDDNLKQVLMILKEEADSYMAEHRRLSSLMVAHAAKYLGREYDPNEQAVNLTDDGDVAEFIVVMTPEEYNAILRKKEDDAMAAEFRALADADEVTDAKD